MTGNAAMGGLGGLLGFWLSSVLPTLALPVYFCYFKLIWLTSGTQVAAGLHGFFTVLNVISVPEVSLQQLKNEGLVVETEGLRARMKGLMKN